MLGELTELSEELLHEVAGGQGSQIDRNGSEKGIGIDPNGSTKP